MIEPAWLQVGGISALPGQTASGHLRIGTPAGDVEVPVVIAHGSRPGPRLALVAGIHGSEYAGIEAAVTVMRDLDPAALAGSVISANIVNVPAFRQRLAYVCPLDGDNLGRVFPGRADGAPSQVIAYHIYREIVAQSDHVIELHGGDIIEDLVPFLILHDTGNARIDQQSLDLVRSYGIHYILQTPSWDGRYTNDGACYAAAAGAGKPSFLAEAGGHGLTGPDAVRVHVEGITRVMHRLGMLSGDPPCRSSPALEPRLTRRYVSVRSPFSGMLRPQVGAGDTVAAGQVVGTVSDYFGRPVGEVRAPLGGTVLWLAVSLSIQSGEALLGIGDFS